jgi:hypothetical protein
MFIMFLGLLFGAGAAIGSFFAGAGAAIGSALGVAATAITGFAKTLAATMSTISMVDIFQIVVSVVTWLSRKNEVLEENETTEELGAKAKQSEAKPDDFESTQAYIEHLRNNIILDKEKYDKLSAEEKLACQLVGIGIATKALSEKKGVEIPPEFLIEVGRQKMIGAEAEAYIDSFKTHNEHLNKFGGYLKNELNRAEDLQVSPILQDALKQLNPNISQSEIDKKLDAMKDIARMTNLENS